ncbi:MAG: RDD family protein [Cytophagaceae bacterium]|nr:RDD family protein [Cytophagaceae bacterium]
MFYNNTSIRPVDRLILLLADPLINALCLYLPLLVLIYPLFFFGFITHYAFIKCNFFLIAATYLNKDIAGGRSLAKRFMGYAVVKQSNGKSPSMATCFLRNITFPIYIIELIYSLFSPSQKIIDHYTKTQITQTVKDSKPITSFYNDMKNISYTNETREVIGLTVLLFLLVLFFNS